MKLYDTLASVASVAYGLACSKVSIGVSVRWKRTVVL